MSYFLCKNFLGDDDFLNKIFYQPAFNMLELKEDKDTECVFSWKSKRIEQNNYLTQFVNIHIVYDLDNWLRNMLNNLHEKCFLKTTNLVRYSNKSKHVYSGYEMNLMKQFRGVLVKTLL